MQRQMQELQEELNRREFEATAGGGAVRVVVNGARELLKVQIDREAVDPEDVEMLEDLVLAAVREAQKRATETVQAEIRTLTGGMGLPGLL